LISNRQKDDWYPTPPSATAALLSREKFGKTIWEPAAGDGAIAKVCEKAGYDVVASDLNDYGYMDALANVDFLMEPERRQQALSGAVQGQSPGKGLCF
jgi:adenine-specific DNA methylase